MRQKKHGSYANHITSGSNDRGSIKKERAMRNRTVLLIVAIIVLGLLAVGGTVGAMALTHSGFMRNGYGYGMMGGQRGYQGMMGGYQQTPAQQGAQVTGVTHMNMQNFAYQVANIQVRAGTTV